MQDFNQFENQYGSAPAEMSPVMIIVWLVILAIYVVSAWKIYVKAGKPGWAAIIPFYNIYVLLKIVGKPGWWLILYIIPIVNIVISLIVSLQLAKSFGRSSLFGVVALWLFSIIGYPILAFDKSKYVGVEGNKSSSSAPAQTPPAAPQTPKPTV